VRATTRRRVREAARRLGYEPNRLARSLRTRSSSFVGVIVPDIAIGFYARAVKGAQDMLERAGYQVLVMNTERGERREIDALRTLLAHRVDGVLLATSGGFDGSDRVPVVFFDNLVPGSGVGNVARANHDGMAMLVSHLTGHGHERIGFVGAPPILTSGMERLEGFRASVAAAGLPLVPEYIRLGDEAWSPPSGERAMLELLDLEEPPTAIVTASDTLAFGALEAVRARGRRIPDDVALVSFDDPLFGDLLDPPVTALARNERELGELAASLLLHALQTGARAAPAEVRLPVELIVRRSCGCR
jgi:LacI family transcriptional regulator, galactose operon repressor